MTISKDAAPWVEIADRKAKQQHARLKWYLPGEIVANADPRQSINIIESHLDSKENEITRTTAVDLISKLASGELSASEVTLAFCKRASYSTQLLNCCTEIMFEDAIERASYLDSYLKENGRPLGPLHGLPVSIKDAFDYKDFDTTSGWTALADKPATQNSPIVDLLLELGAVLYVKTNLPATMMTADSTNVIFGQTKNPYNTELTAGGSSGGEGSLIGALGSPLGVGSDIAGSIRMPALCNGTYGLRPSINRFPIEGHLLPIEAGSGLLIHGVAGPLANSVEDLKLLTQTLLDAKPWKKDVTLYPLDYRKVTAPAKLKIGVLYDNGLIQPHPPVKRGLDICVQKLRAAGHDVFEISPAEFPSLETLHSTCFGSYSMDGFRASRDMHHQTGEDYIKSFRNLKYETMPGPSSVKEVFKLNDAMLQLQYAMNKWWHETFDSEFDVLLCPGAPFVAVKHDEYSNFQYTMLWNCVDYPAGIIPVAKVDKTIDLPDSSFIGRSQEDIEINAKYDPELMHGAPICVQVVGQKMREEELLESMAIIDSALKA